MSKNDHGNNGITDREKLCASKMMECLSVAAAALSSAHEWMDELESLGWYSDDYGISMAERGLTQQLAHSYSMVSEAFQIPYNRDVVEKLGNA